MPTTSRPARRARLLAPVALVVAGVGAMLAGCGADAPSQAELRDALIDSGVSKQVATCAAEAVTTELSDDELTELAQRGGGGAPVDDPNTTDDTADQVREALTRCRDLGAGLTTEPSTDTTNVLDAVTTTTTAVPATTDDAEFNTTSEP